MKNFRTLQLAIQFHKDTQSLQLREPYRDQFERAILSVCLNLAEGSAKPTSKDRRKFYSIALGSLREVQLILELTGHATELQQSNPVAGSLYRLLQNPGHRP